MRTFLALACLVAGLCGACAPVGPDYRAPEASLPDSYIDGTADPLGAAAHEAWWRRLNDPVLDNLMARGLAQNLSVRAAEQRVRQAEAIAAANGIDAALGGDAEIGLTNVWTEEGMGEVSEQARANLGFNLDVFGARARAREESTAQYQSALYDVGHARLRYQEALVTAYINARHYQTVLYMAEASVARQLSMAEIAEGNRALGGTTVIDARRERAELADRQAELPKLRAQIHVAAQQIGTLINLSGQNVLALLATGGGLPVPPGGLDAGIPADLLRNRPDILAAERDLAAAVAGIGVQQAQLYPSLALAGNITLQPGMAISLGPRLTVPLLSIPGQRALAEAARARAAEAEILWRQTVLGAVEDVETYLAVAEGHRQEIAVRERAVREYRATLSLVREGAGLGANSPMDVIRAEADLAEAGTRLTRAEADYALAWARLNVATGRGWQAGTDQ